MSLDILYDPDEIAYLGIFLTRQSQEKLKHAIPPAFKQKSGDHVTIIHSPDEEQIAKFAKLVGKKIVLTATHEVVTDKVQAIKIKDIWTARGTPHVTISWADGASPSDANVAVSENRGFAIQPWLKLEGYFDVFPRSFDDHGSQMYRRNPDSKFRRLQRLYQLGELDPERYIREFERIYEDAPLPELGLEIERSLIVSTAHITQGDATTLDAIVVSETPAWILVPHFDYGWWLYVSDSEFPEMLPRAHEIFSPALVNLLKFAYEENCQWLRLDNDGPEYEDFPIFDW